jgi:DUF1680 family protein
MTLPANMPASTLGGLLGEALAANLRGRLSHFIVDETSPAIALFAPAARAGNTEGDWYGEHAGKWLVAAAKAAARSNDAELRARVLRVADWLCSVQEADGYLGTYAPERRFLRAQPPRPYSWNGEPALRTWDVWTHAYLVLGLLECWTRFGVAAHRDAARRIGDLCWRVFGEGGVDITTLGNHFGLSATVLLEPALELHRATGDPRYLQLAERIHAQAESHPESAIVARALAGADPSEISTGKAYQLLWNLAGIAKLHEATGRRELLEAVERQWVAIRDGHLTPGGGPWGGVAHRSREVFNAAGTFSPQGYVETCSVLAWIQLSKRLLAITGAARYAEEIERSAYNDLLTAQAPDGEDWCYYTFPNGRRVHTTYWRCCKSSGAMALEELPEAACTRGRDGGVAIHLYGPAEHALTVDGVALRIVQRGDWPYDGALAFTVHASVPLRLALSLRIPAWAEGASVRVGDAVAVPASPASGYVLLDREWRDGDIVHLDLPMAPRAEFASNRNVQVARAPDGSPVEQEVLRQDFVSLARGPLSYATGLLDGYKREESLALPAGPAGTWLGEAPDRAAGEPPRLLLRPLHRPAIPFVPAFLADGRRDGGWRLTWMPMAPAPDADPVS